MSLQRHVFLNTLIFLACRARIWSQRRVAPIRIAFRFNSFINEKYVVLITDESYQSNINWEEYLLVFCVVYNGC